MTQKTPYSEKEVHFTNKAHLCARRVIYPLLVPDSDCTYDNQEPLQSSPKWQVLDGELGIDRIIHLRAKNSQAPFTFTAQERFRRTSFAAFKDVTITAWNKASNTPSELYKLGAQFFVYGFYDEAADDLTQWIVLDVPTLMLSLARRQLKITVNNNPRSNQKFINIQRDELRRVGAVVLEA
jgi:hypothetical protein